MARVTVENCIDKIPNRFDLVLLASQRARALAAGSPLTIDRDNDKNPVVALREVAEETISPEELLEAAIYNLRKHVEVDEPEEDDLTLLMAAQAHGGDAAESSGGRPVGKVSEPEVHAGGGAEAPDAVQDAEPAGQKMAAANEESLDGLSSNYFADENDIVEADDGKAAKAGGSGALGATEDKD